MELTKDLQNKNEYQIRITKNFSKNRHQRKAGLNLAQRVSIAIHRGNAASLLGTLLAVIKLRQFYFRVLFYF
jgi:hypothetical protein